MTEASVAGTFSEPTVEALVAGRTHPGQRRSENQDNLLIAELGAEDRAVILRPDAGDLSDDVRFRIGQRGLLLVVADGMGGAAAGRLASGLACTFILAELQDVWLSDRDTTPNRFAMRLQEAVEKANARMHQHAGRNADTVGMGSTVTAAGVLGGYVYVAQVGDSRAYLTRSGVTTQITRDQSLVQQMIDAGALRPEDAESSAHANVILQALGVRPSVEVDVSYQELCRGDVLVLCSDGLHRVVAPAEITQAVEMFANPAAVCEQLIALANARGGPDNVTVLAARLDGGALSAARPGDLVGRTSFPFESGPPGMTR
jgi:PPM family protein phosphatase